jgi:hypothetical protein
VRHLDRRDGRTLARERLPFAEHLEAQVGEARVIGVVMYDELFGGAADRTIRVTFVARPLGLFMFRSKHAITDAQCARTGQSLAFVSA